MASVETGASFGSLRKSEVLGGQYLANMVVKWKARKPTAPRYTAPKSDFGRDPFNLDIGGVEENRIFRIGLRR